jgi:hypothetical protein
MSSQLPQFKKSRRYQRIGLLFMTAAVIGMFAALYASFYLGMDTAITDRVFAISMALLPTGAIIIKFPIRRLL